MPVWIVAIWNWLKARQVGAHKAALWVGIAFLCGAICCRQWRKNVIDSEPPPAFTFGWRDEPEHVRKVVGSFKLPYFGDAAKPLIQTAEDKDAFLWQAYERVTGKPWQPHDQNGVGSCVGQGWSAAIEILTCVEIALDNEAQEYKPISAASIYAFSREVGNFLGNQDGSTGADAAKAVMTLGSLSSEEAGDDNHNTSIGAKLCKQWGRSGVPNDKRSVAAQHKIKTASLVRTPEEVRAALVNGYVVPICASIGFEGRGGHKRDADGFCWPGGTWPHCQVIAGYRKDKRAFLVINSWANVPSGPKTLGQPEGSYWISWDACQRVVKSGDCYAVSGFDGFKSRDLDWRVRLPAREPVRLARALFPLAY